MHICPDCQRCYDDPELSCSQEGHASLSPIRDGGPGLVPGYSLDVFLGADVTGETYYGHHIGTGGPCLITIRSADDVHTIQFIKEAERAAAFCHPNVVDVYDSGQLDTGEVFIVSEDAEGDTLYDILSADGVPKLSTTIAVVRQIAEALEALHKNGLAHGAINPRNILWTAGPQNQPLARIRDLDLGGLNSTAVTSSSFHDDDGLYMLRYFAPEQCSGSGPNARGDIYSLGVVLYEMLAGDPPFTASKAAGLIEQHRNRRPPEIRIDDIDLRMLLTHTLSEALQKKPELRQASANVFARQMRHIEQLAAHSSVAPAPVVAAPREPLREQPSGLRVPEKPGDISPAVHAPQGAQAATVSASTERRSIQWQQPEDDIPSEADALEALSGDVSSVEVRTDVTAAAFLNAADSSAVDEPVHVLIADPDGPLSEAPTAVIANTAPVDRSQPLFSSVEIASVGSGLWRSTGLRTAALVVLPLAAALGAYLFLSHGATTAPGSGEPPQTQVSAVPAEHDQVNSDEGSYPATAATAVTEDVPAPAEIVKVVEPNAAVSKDTRSATREESPVPEQKDKKNAATRPELIGKNVAPRSLPPSIVITYGGEKAAPKTKPISKPVAVSRSEATRPRIVKNPKP